MAKQGAAKKQGGMIEIPSLKMGVMRVKIRGKTDLIVHAWSDKAKGEMRDKQQGIATAPRENKDPVAEFEAAKYKDTEGRDCIKALAIKCAIVSAARVDDKYKMTQLRQSIFVRGELLPIAYERCVMREDMVRLPGMKADLRYRPAYQNWTVSFEVEWAEGTVMNAQKLLYLVNLGGFSVGIHEWRPERDGDFGRFELDSVEPVSVPVPEHVSGNGVAESSLAAAV
jgi:hypothetical protein